MLHCPYKVWNLNRLPTNYVLDDVQTLRNSTIHIPSVKITPHDRLGVAAFYYASLATKSQENPKIKVSYGSSGLIKTSTIQLSKYSDKAKQLIDDLQKMISADAPPVFYKNPHCPDCQFRTSCYQKLKERDCISILAGINTTK